MVSRHTVTSLISNVKEEQLVLSLRPLDGIVVQNLPFYQAVLATSDKRALAGCYPILQCSRLTRCSVGDV